MCNNLVGLFDRCYKHEAFSADQRHTLLHWRGPLCNKLQTSGKSNLNPCNHHHH